jgi:predicted esterase
VTRRLALAVLLTGSVLLRAADLPDIMGVPEDLKVPAISESAPAAGLRVRQTSAGWEGTAVHHTLYLPVNWKPGGKFPVLVEFAGNGGYKNAFGDTCDGTVEGGNLGYGISGGADYICIGMPFVKAANGLKENAANWWGDADETAAYCTATVRQVCRDFGGDEKAVVLCGFSRGSIACNYIGLRNDTIASLWRAFICHSHYDGVRTTWPYGDADRASALARLQRLNGRPQFLSHEGSVDQTRDYLFASGVRAAFEFSALPFRNHTDRWALRDCEQRRKVRAWLRLLGLPAQ